MYGLQACESLINRYIQNGGNVVTIEEGTLGAGLIVCYGNGLKTAIIREVYLNEWASTHSVRFYNKMPEKYKKMIEKVGCYS